MAAKLKGAIASKCLLTAVPEDNYNQLVDGVIYNGPSLVADTQVIGIATLAEAVATVRMDRDPSLAQAIERFSALRQTSKGKPAFYKTKEAKDALSEVAALAPRHYSAVVLQLWAQGKLPKTLSATASQYYTSLATSPAVGVLQRRDKGNSAGAVPSSAVKAGLADLRKLRPLADESVRPLIDAWSRFIEAVAALQEKTGSQQAVERQRQVLLDEMARERADADMLQKMLKEGM